MPAKRKKQEEEKKPLLFRDGVLLMIAAAGSGGCMYMADAQGGDLATAFRAWAYILGGIALVILFSMITDKNRNRKKPDL